MTNDANDKCSLQPMLVAHRYRVEALLGSGGMAAVFRVYDTATDRNLALKRLLQTKEATDDGARQHREEIERLFENEFYSLAQLAHPRVIEVMDFGRDENRAYYTMELLDGGDLRARAPLPWREACSYLRDVCSALSLLHSRRQLHRDLTPRNIRCTQDSRAKLIDFGAMSPMGPSKYIVGTPPFSAPEVVNQQMLDARTDLFSLGATAYYVLTGRNAFPARNFKELRDFWRSPLKPPSRLARDIPAELDELILSLLSLSPLARPLNAAEVMDRLTAIAGLKADEQLAISQSYLTTPLLVGRDDLLLDVRKQMVRALRKRGGTVLVQGEPGVGRSRFLDACVLEGKLVGAVVLKTDATDSASGRWGAVRSLGLQLLKNFSGLALAQALPDASILAHILPELQQMMTDYRYASGAKKPESEWERISHIPTQTLDTLTPGMTNQLNEPSGAPTESSWTNLWGRRISSMPPPPVIYTSEIELVPIENPEDFRILLQDAFQRWLLSLGERKCIVIAVDDLNKIDEPSAAFLVRISEEAKRRKLVLVITIEGEAVPNADGAIGVLFRAGNLINLENLEKRETEILLSSVFGEVAHVRLLADHLHTVTRGNPRAIMWMAEHLIDKGAIRYRAGAWSLPPALVAADLPSSLNETLSARIEVLGLEARSLAETLALSPELSFDFHECLELTEHRSSRQLAKSIDDLIATQVISTNGQFYGIGRQGWVQVLREKLDAQRERELHLRLARVLGQREEEFLRVAGHLMKAGEETLGLEAILTRIGESQERHRQNPKTFAEDVYGLPEDWVAIYKRALGLHCELGRPVAERYQLLYSLTGISAVTDVPSHQDSHSMLDLLIPASGLSIYLELGDSVEESARLGKALELATERYNECPESKRLMPPGEAILEIALAVTQGISMAISALDYPFLKGLPSLEPFAPLSPAIGVIEKLATAVGYFLSSRYESCIQQYGELIQRIDEPDRAGLEEIYRELMRLGSMNAMGWVSAWLGLEVSLELAAEMEQNPWCEANGWSIRVFYHLCRGDVVEANECKKRQELIEIRDTNAKLFTEMHRFQEVIGYSLAEDLNGIRRVMQGLLAMAEKYETWKPIWHFAQGEYQRLCTNSDRALDAYDICLAQTAAGQHALWPLAAGACVRTLLDVGRIEEALEKGDEFLEQAEAAELEWPLNYIRLPVALARAKTGDCEVAFRAAHEAIDDFERLGAGGILMAYAYEVCARIAMIADHFESFSTYVVLAAKLYGEANNHGLRLRYERLMQEARKYSFNYPEKHEQLDALLSHERVYVDHYIVERLQAVEDPGIRLKRALELLVQKWGACGGFLYVMRNDRPTLVSKLGSLTPPPELDEMVSDYLSAELKVSKEVTLTVDDLAQVNGEPDSTSYTRTIREGSVYHPVILGHTTPDGEYLITGVVVFHIGPGAPGKATHEILRLVSETLAKTKDAVAVPAA